MTIIVKWKYCANLILLAGCGESNLWPQFPVTLKTRVVEINVFNAYKILECVTINQKRSQLLRTCSRKPIYLSHDLKFNSSIT